MIISISASQKRFWYTVQYCQDAAFAVGLFVSTQQHDVK